MNIQVVKVVIFIDYYSERKTTLIHDTMWLFSVLVVLSIIIPFSLSFAQPLVFYKKWKVVLPAIIVVYILYSAINIQLHISGVWQFSNYYHMNYTIFSIPVEEWLFFLGIPYSSIFVYDAIQCCWPKYRMRREVSKVMNFLLLTVLVPLFLSTIERYYTSTVLGLLILSLLWSMLLDRNIIGRYFATFLFMIIPFVLFRSILTGIFLNEEIVQYNDTYILGYRFLTIPIEDFGYLFSYVLFTLLVRQAMMQSNFLSSKHLNHEEPEEQLPINNKLNKIIY